jgi:LysM repeat protein
MADESAEVGSVFMKKIGPLPVIAWAGIAGVVYYVVKKRAGSSAKTTTATATNASGEAGTMGTDPAGNTGLIDPSTGYVYGTPSDQAALGGSGSSGSSGSSSGTSSTPKYTTNQEWENAAIDYLVGLGVDPVGANSAIAAYLGSQSLSVTQQAEVNETIQSLGAPPQPPSPATSPPVVNPPGTSGGPYAKNPPTGLATSSVTATSASLKWNAATGAKGYTVTYQPAKGTAATESTSQPFITLSGLKPQTAYRVSVQATPADAGAGTASITVTTPYGAIGGGGVPVTAPASLKAGQQIAVQVNITGGKTMASVASSNGIALQHLIDFNPGSSASTKGVVNVPYLVKKGDTLDSIAGHFGISPEHLAQELAGQGIV